VRKRSEYDPGIAAPTPIVIVGGPPASGKTTLARRLAADLSLPLITKDGLKETLFEAVGVGDLEWSRRLGRGAIALVWHVLEAEVTANRSVLVEGNFDASVASGELNALAERHPFTALEIHCCAEPAVLESRFVGRAATRHPGHVEADQLESLGELLDAARYVLAVPGKRVTYDTTEPTEADYAGIQSAVAAHMASSR
jgi:predicted kinase